MANYSSDLSFMPEHELVELLWENGQVVMQGQSNRTKKSSLGTEFAFNGRLEEKGCEDDATMLKFGQTGAIDLPPTVPCAMNGQEDYTAPWMNYDDSLQNDFFSELTGVHMPSLSDTNSNLNPADKSTGFGQATKDSNIFRSNPGGSEPSRSRFNHLLNMPQQCQFLSENAKSRVLDVGISNGKSNHLGHCGDLNSTRFQKEDKYAQKHLHQSSSVGLMNFSHFSRPAALVKSNLHRIDRLSNHEKSCTDASTYPVESTLVESSNGLKSPNGIHRSMEAPTQPKVLNRSSSSPDHSSFAASMAVERNEAERGAEAAVATSSVCSGYSAGATSNDPKHKSKKRSCEGEESGEQSDELEDDSFAVKKTSSGRGTNGKRSRAAEVHNMSERRRRDRINEKMRALQDLIPNCNKVDKASMLDEAIEYLKTLQLQVQMMSMGSGLCMPPMMLPAGMNFQHMRAPPITHFSPMGVGMGIGMGMGLGFGMGMIDLNGSPGLIPVSPIHGTQFPCPSVPGVSGLHWRPPSSSIQSLGIPGPRLPAAVPHAPLFSSQAGLSPQGTLMNPLQVSDAPPSSSNNQQQQCINLDAIENASNKKAKGQASQTVCPLMHKNI